MLSKDNPESACATGRTALCNELCLHFGSAHRCYILKSSGTA